MHSIILSCIYAKIDRILTLPKHLYIDSIIMFFWSMTKYRTNKHNPSEEWFILTNDKIAALQPFRYIHKHIILQITENQNEVQNNNIETNSDDQSHGNMNTGKTSVMLTTGTWVVAKHSNTNTTEMNIYLYIGEKLSLTNDTNSQMTMSIKENRSRR